VEEWPGTGMVLDEPLEEGFHQLARCRVVLVGVLLLPFPVALREILAPLCGERLAGCVLARLVLQCVASILDPALGQTGVQLEPLSHDALVAPVLVPAEPRFDVGADRLARRPVVLLGPWTVEDNRPELSGDPGAEQRVAGAPVARPRGARVVCHRRRARLEILVSVEALRDQARPEHLAVLVGQEA